jgi:CubicO group peptidase (beta-lactamase class C family)
MPHSSPRRAIDASRRRCLAVAPALLAAPALLRSEPAAARVSGAPGPLRDLLEGVAADGTNTHGVVVRKAGQLLAEAYYTALDKPGGSWFSREVAFGPDTLHDLRSISKSVVALLVGIAQARGLLGDLARPVFDHLPEHADLLTPERRALSVQHLLDMATGWRWDETTYSYADPRNSETRMSLSLNPLRHMLALPLVATPGTTWEYCGGATLVLAEILERQARAPLATLARDWLFEPLGVRTFEWRTGLTGKALAFSGLRLTPRDLAAVGELLITRGQHGGKSVVPAEWVDSIRRPRYSGWDRYRYASQWWHSREEAALAWVGGWGNGGQRLLVVPDRELVVVVTAGRYNQPMNGRASMELFRRIVEALA